MRYGPKDTDCLGLSNSTRIGLVPKSQSRYNRAIANILHVKAYE
jgi:hypothetical protein